MDWNLGLILIDIVYARLHDNVFYSGIICGARTFLVYNYTNYQSYRWLE